MSGRCDAVGRCALKLCARAISIVIAVAIIWAAQGISWVVVLVCGIFILFAAGILGGIFWFTSVPIEKIPELLKIPAIGPVVKSISEAPPEAMHSKSLFWGATGLQLLIIILDAATLDAMLRSIGYSSSPEKVFASFSIAGVASMVSLIPGGVGAFEGVQVLMLGLLRVPVNAGLAATLMLRALVLWIPMIPGFFILRRESKHLVEEDEEISYLTVRIIVFYDNPCQYRLHKLTNIFRKVEILATNYTNCTNYLFAGCLYIFMRSISVKIPLTFNLD